jgi:glycolate oxidase iron-sulfur subunit
MADTTSKGPKQLSLKAFDAHHPPSEKLISDCVHCGFCLPTCPTYQLWGEEADSPRGRVYLMKLASEGQVPLDDDFVGHFDRCLGCMACLTSCPSGVQYEKLIEATRAQIERRHERTSEEKFLRRMIFAVFPYPDRLRLLSLPLWVLQRTGMQSLIRRSGLLSLLPKRLRVIESLAPDVRFERATEAVPTAGKARLRVGLLLGCVQRVFFGDVNQATARVLAAEGCDVVIPQDQGCCGALMTHAGEEEAAVAFARRTIDTFEAAQVDVIAINAAGCGSAMKEYGHLLRDDPVYAKRAEALAAKCRDVSEILVGLEPRAVRHPLTMKVAYHDACHLQHAQRVAAQPRKLLNAIPGLELKEIAEPATCCGSAGIYNLLQPETAQQLGQRKARHVINTGAGAIVSGNPGCTLQLRASLEAEGRPIPVLHWVQLVDASIAGTDLSNLASR